MAVRGNPIRSMGNLGAKCVPAAPSQRLPEPSATTRRSVPRRGREIVRALVDLGGPQPQIWPLVPGWPPLLLPLVPGSPLLPLVPRWPLLPLVPRRP